MQHAGSGISGCAVGGRPAQQMQMYVQLLNNVSASAEGFERSQFSIVGIRRWVADHFPARSEYDLPEAEPGDDPPDQEKLANIKLRLKPSANMPNAEELRAVLGMEPQESLDASNPEQLAMLQCLPEQGARRLVLDGDLHTGRLPLALQHLIPAARAAIITMVASVRCQHSALQWHLLTSQMDGIASPSAASVQSSQSVL